MELFNTEVAVRSLGPLLAGLSITVMLTLIVIVLALVLGLPSRWPRLYAPRWVRWLVPAYVEIMRGTPLLLQLIYIYYVLPEVGIRLNAFTAAMHRPDAQLRRLHLGSLPRRHRGGGQGPGDAAAALGMTRGLALRRIILPQAIRTVIPALGNYPDLAVQGHGPLLGRLACRRSCSRRRSWRRATTSTSPSTRSSARSISPWASRRRVLVDWLERRTRQGYRPSAAHEPRRRWSRRSTSTNRSARSRCSRASA